MVAYLSGYFYLTTTVNDGMIPTALRSMLVYDAVHSSILIGVSSSYTSTLVASPVRGVYYADRRSGVLEVRKEGWMYAQETRGRLWMLIGWLALMGMGCTHVISETVRQQAQPSVSFAELRTNPEALKGRTVILGGEILQTTNLRDGTRIEADAFVFACGPWLPSLFPDVVGANVRATRQDVFYFGPPAGDTGFSAPARLPSAKPTLQNSALDRRLSTQFSARPTTPTT